MLHVTEKAKLYSLNMEYHQVRSTKILMTVIRLITGMTLAMSGLVGCNSLPPLPPPVGSSTPSVPINLPVRTALKLGPEDSVNIVVYDHADLSMSVVVAADGSFSYPLLGHVQAEGLTAQELADHLTKALSEYLVNPQVNVTVQQFQSQQIYVVGEVNAPGLQVLKHPTTLLELLVKVGGPTPNAGEELMVIRPNDRDNGTVPTVDESQTKRPTLRVNIEKLLAGEIPQRIQLYSGDTVYIPKADFFYVDGQVRSPGRHRLQRDMTVAKALIVAGGVTQFASKSRIKIRRIVDGQRREFRARMLDLLQPDDVLIVPESIF